MNVVTQVFAVLAGVIHVGLWVLESLLIGRPQVHKGIFGQRTEDLPLFRIWSFNQGFYNLFLAVGPLLGVLLYNSGCTAAGQALVIYGCAFIFLAGIVLVASDRKFWRGALGQSVPTGIALLALLF
jgi:putative membrane protein